MPRTRIKICGLTREADVDTAVDAGADAIGFVFYPPSKRALTPERAAVLRARIPAFVNVVALFVDPDEAYLREVVAAVSPDLLQFHGNETPDTCETFAALTNRRYLRAFRVGAPGLDTPQALLESCLHYGSAAGWLYDSYTPGFGGSGRGFDWSLITTLARHADARPVVLSGGLNAANAVQALDGVRPFAVDVSSGVESEPGIKDAGKIHQFVAAIRRADDLRNNP